MHSGVKPQALLADQESSPIPAVLYWDSRNTHQSEPEPVETLPQPHMRRINNGSPASVIRQSPRQRRTGATGSHREGVNKSPGFTKVTADWSWGGGGLSAHHGLPQCSHRLSAEQPPPPGQAPGPEEERPPTGGPRRSHRPRPTTPGGGAQV